MSAVRLLAAVVVLNVDSADICCNLPLLLQLGNSGRVPLAAVPSILAELGAQCPADEVPRIFGGPQRAPDAATISYRDFLIALSAGNLLGLIGMGCPPTGVAGGAGGAPPAVAGGAAAGGAGGSAAITNSPGAPLGGSPAARRASFTQEAALAREGDSAAAAQLAADTARRLHSSEERHAAGGGSSGSLRRPSGGRASLTGGLSVPSPGLSGSLSSSGADSARMPPAEDPAALAWAFHLMLEAFLQLSNGGCIHKKDLLAGMTQLAMLSPSTRTLQHGRKDKPVRTHALEVTADGAAAPVGEGGAAGGAGDGEHHVGFAPGGAAATVIGTAATADAGESSSAGPTTTDAAAADGGAVGGDAVQVAARRGSASAPREPRSSGAGSGLAEAAAGAAAGGAGGDHRPRIVPASALEFLTAERWRELDKNGDASVTLLEFLGCFMTSWLSTDDDDDEDEDEGESDSAALAVQRAAADAAAIGLHA